MEQNHQCTVHDITQNHMVHNKLITRKVESHQQGVIQNYLKKIIKNSDGSVLSTSTEK